MLPLNDLAKIRPGAKRLQIARPRREVLPDLDVRRRIELAEAAQVRAFRADVRDVEQHPPRQFVLEAGIPLLHVGRARIGVDAEVAREAARRRVRESVLGGKHGRKIAIGLVGLVRFAVEYQVVSLDRDLLAEIDAISGAEDGKASRQ